MAEFSEISIQAGKRKLRAISAGEGSQTALFLHGGVPGAELYASGCHIWGGVLDLFAKDRRVIAIDLAGSADGLDEPQDFTIEATAAAIRTVIADRPVHFVGHELGAMIGVHLAITNPQLLRSVSIVTSPMTAPTADAVSNVTFNHPPLPRLSRTSQRWALERLSYSDGHITPSLLEACIAAAEGPFQERVAALGATAVTARARQSMRSAQLQQWETCRGEGIKVPVQVIWATHDPLASRAANYLLFSTIAEKQRAAQFHIVNRAGALPFREQPEIFTQIVAAFQDGVALEAQ